MKKTNFLKAFAMAAVVMFAASCSEESLDINNGSINVDPTILPEPTASISVTVVDLEAGGKIIGGVSTVNATAAIGGTMTVECPANEGYTTAAAVEVAVPALSKGQSINIPVTFYVTTLGSAWEDFYQGSVKTEEPIEGEEPAITVLAIADAAKKAENVAEGWILNEDGTISFKNDTDEDLVAFQTAPYFYFDIMEGFEFVKEVVESKAAETTLLDLVKTQKFTTRDTYMSWNIAKWAIFTINKISQTFELKKIKIENKEMNASVEFIANVAGAVKFEVERTDMEIDHNLGHEDINNGHEDINNSHNNSHNGHGHGGSSNAGGGIAGNEGE